VRRVKLMADYGAFPLWAVPDGGPVSIDDYWCGGLAPEDLPLSASLVAELCGWAETHDRLLGPSFEWPSDEAKVAFADEGRRLLGLVRAEVGRTYDVIYFDEVTGCEV
jgi:hypothetical protein